jgi:hypothetical protein
MYFNFGMPVCGSDGDEVGTLERVLIAPDTREVTHLVVRSPRVSEDVLLPLNMVQGNMDSHLLLYAASDDFANLPRYYEGRTSSPPAGRVDTSVVREPAERRQSLDDALAVPANALELGPEACITTADGSDGQLAGLMVEEYVNHLAALCVHGLCGDDLLVPAAAIDGLHPGAITLSATCDQFHRVTASPTMAAAPGRGDDASEATERDRAERWRAEHTAAE